MLKFIAVILAALTFAPAFAHLAEMPVKLKLDGEPWYATQFLYQSWGAFLGPIEAVTLLVTAWWLWSRAVTNPCLQCYRLRWPATSACSRVSGCSTFRQTLLSRAGVQRRCRRAGSLTAHAGNGATQHERCLPSSLSCASCTQRSWKNSSTRQTAISVATGTFSHCNKGSIPIIQQRRHFHSVPPPAALGGTHVSLFVPSLVKTVSTGGNGARVASQLPRPFEGCSEIRRCTEKNSLRAKFLITRSRRSRNYPEALYG